MDSAQYPYFIHQKLLKTYKFYHCKIICQMILKTGSVQTHLISVQRSDGGFLLETD
jgi:hypothetical protein